MSTEEKIDTIVAKIATELATKAGTSSAYDGDRCMMCGHEVSPGALLANSLANGALPKIHEHLLRATRLYTDELGALRKRVPELEALVDASARMLDEVRAGRDEAPSLWRSLSDGQRLELMALCCSSCGALDPRCQCGNDE